jgi:hypothetical protein
MPSAGSLASQDNAGITDRDDGGWLALQVMVGTRMLRLDQSNDKSAYVYKSASLGRISG